MKKGKILSIAAMLCILLSACCVENRSPGPEEIYEYMQKNRDDITVVLSYLLEQDCNSFLVRDKKGQALMDLKKVQIKDCDVVNSIQALWQSGCSEICKRTDWNCIQFTIWTRSIGEIDCGFLYALCLDELPEVQYQTELIPLQETGWYYYKVEYNKWHTVHQSMDTDLRGCE